MSTKNYKLNGVATEIELGKKGVRLDGTNADYIANRKVDGSLARVKVATPIDDDDAVTKRFLETRSDVVVTGGIDGGTPPSVVNGEIYLCHTTGGTFTEDYLYRGEDGSWVEIVPYENMLITISNATVPGFDADTLYSYDLQGTTWVKIGPATPLTGLVKVLRGSIDNNSASSFTLGQMPAGASVQEVRINVTQAFNGTAPTFIVGDTTDADRLMEIIENDLEEVALFIATRQYRYASATNITIALETGASTQGSATIEVVYSLT